MSIRPVDIQARRADGMLRITWSDEAVSELSFVALRASCQCAVCVDEITGRRRLDPSTVADDITIEGMDAVGNYAIRIRWSDGHSSGLYTWEFLRSLGAETE